MYSTDIRCIFYISLFFLWCKIVKVTGLRWEDRNISKIEFRRNLTYDEIIDYMDYSRIINLPSSESRISDFVPQIEESKSEDPYLGFLKKGLVPDLVDRIGYHNDCLAVEVDCKEVRLTPNIMELFPAKKMVYQPDLNWYPTENFYYTTIMLDLDFPNRRRPTDRELLLWLKVNVPEDKFKKGQTLVEYLPPIPGNGTGEHRIAVIIFEYKKPIKFNERYITAKQLEQRKHFSTIDFMQKYPELGDPVGGQWFYTKWDSSVDETYKKYFG